MNSSGEFQVQYAPGQVAGVERIIARVTTNQSAFATLNIRVPSLAAVTSSGNLLIGGALPEHPANTYATALTSARIRILADTFYALTDSVKIPFNDVSLEWGGLFDLDKNFAVGQGHAEHKCGKDVDVVDKVGTAIPYLEAYLALLTRSQLIRGVYSRHGAGSYHLRLGGN